MASAPVPLSDTVGVIGYVPTLLVEVAVVLYVAVMLFPFLMPVIVPVNTGFGSP